ncbi:hypothetical protein [Paraburkholderia sp. Ac-20347]|uniref:hypothetical protein n=1 Tax=Paraburkholderia sp. Ac-20347 TaxID=2703892 RepID=UPI00197E40FA|nr:hypothetical protein [Paraburkholderia sp. Ac-20347]MBN3809434.1 hypothetical protein [Paraburkholderia sp. Ac-20347]
MSLEQALADNTAAMKELTAALLSAGTLQNAQAMTSPGVQAVVRAQKEADAKNTDGAAAAAPAEEVVNASKPSGKPSKPTGNEPSPEPEVDLQPWAAATAEVYGELKDADATADNVKKAILAINAKIGRPQAEAVLARFGVQAVTSKGDKRGLDLDQYPAFLVLCLDVLSGRVDATLAIPEAA